MQSLSSSPSDSWSYPLTDSSYDSLENELDHSSGSPGCSRQPRPRTLQGSLDSILTFSDQDTDPEPQQSQGLKSHPLSRTGGRRLKPDLPHPSLDTQAADTSSNLDSLSLGGQQRRRRSSEPAIAYVTKFGPSVSGSADLTGEDEDGEEEVCKNPSSCTQSRGETKKGRDKTTSVALEVSSSSLSSLDSPDFLSSDHTWARRRGLYLPRTHLPSNPSSTAAPPTGVHPDLGTCPKGSPPKETLNWGTMKGCQGLHPNSWLKKGRRLSLTQQDNLEKEEEEVSQTTSTRKTE